MNMQTHPQTIRLRFSVNEYRMLFENGILKDLKQSEIINGELFEKRNVNEKQKHIIDNLVKYIIENTSENIVVETQKSIRLSDYNKVEPAIALSDSLNTLLVVEVSDSTLNYDRNVKRYLYAEAKIPEFWIVNLLDNIVEVHQNPSNGIYQLVNIFNQDETVQSSILPEISISVDKILG